MSRKPHVIVPQDKYVEVMNEVDVEWVILDDIAEHLNVTPATARRKMDGLVSQDILEVRSGRLRSYRLVGDVRD